jgi:hypothetical protein
LVGIEAESGNPVTKGPAASRLAAGEPKRSPGRLRQIEAPRAREASAKIMI